MGKYMKETVLVSCSLVSDWRWLTHMEMTSFDYGQPMGDKYPNCLCIGNFGNMIFQTREFHSKIGPYDQMDVVSGDLEGDRSRCQRSTSTEWHRIRWYGRISITLHQHQTSSNMVECNALKHVKTTSNCMGSLSFCIILVASFESRRLEGETQPTASMHVLLIYPTYGGRVLKKIFQRSHRSPTMAFSLNAGEHD